MPRAVLSGSGAASAQPNNLETLMECCPRNGHQLELSCVYLMRNRKDPEIDTEPTIEQLCIVVAGNGVRVCHHVD